MRTWVDTSKWPDWRLRAERVGLTIAEIARGTNTPDATARKYANGQRRTPDAWLGDVNRLIDEREATA